VTISLNTDQILTRLDHGNQWTQGTWGDPADTEAPTCLHGAIRACQPTPGDAYLIRQVAERQGWGTTFNDAVGTEWHDIEVALLTHREVTDADLADTFGPTWEITVDTVRTIAAATPTQIQALAAARAAAWDAAWAAARDAAWAAARDAAWDAWAAAWAAARDAAWAAARDAAWAAARDAAWDATNAGVVIDLVGQHGLPADHIRTIAGPWCAVFPDSALAHAVTALED